MGFSLGAALLLDRNNEDQLQREVNKEYPLKVAFSLPRAHYLTNAPFISSLYRIWKLKCVERRY